MWRIFKYVLLAVWLGLAGSIFFRDGRFGLPTRGIILRPRFMQTCTPEFQRPVCECLADQLDREQRWADLSRWERSGARGLEPWIFPLLEACADTAVAGPYPPSVMKAAVEKCQVDRPRRYCECIMSAMESRVPWTRFLKFASPSSREDVVGAIPGSEEWGPEVYSQCGLELAGPNGEWPDHIVSAVVKRCEDDHGDEAPCSCMAERLRTQVSFKVFLQVARDDPQAFQQMQEASAEAMATCIEEQEQRARKQKRLKPRKSR